MPCQQEVTLPVSFITTVMPTMLQIFNTKEVSNCLYKMAYLTKNLPSYLFVACSHLDLADGGAWFSQQMKRCQDCWASCNAVEWTPLSSPGGGKTCRALLMTAKNMQPPKHKGDCLKKHKETHPAPKKKKKKRNQNNIYHCKSPFFGAPWLHREHITRSLSTLVLEHHCCKKYH